MNQSAHNSKQPQHPDTQAVLAEVQNGQGDALHLLALKACEYLADIASAVHRRMGSPDHGVNGESDLAQSVAASIIASPQAHLNEIYTADDLRARLYKLLYCKWVDKRRRAAAAKRGGGQHVQASQAEDAERPGILDIAARGYGEFPPATPAELSVELQEILDTFPIESERRRIVTLLLEGWTQQEIADNLNLSRDAVGRRVRQSIAPALRFLNPET
ncbi:MAG: helix-turn-helix domain-containing protein [Planctomycetaceae bacterium]|nr:helix-turn-helix domain-containing protein [Planctomycetaceae bacterium]